MKKLVRLSHVLILFWEIPLSNEIVVNESLIWQIPGHYFVKNRDREYVFANQKTTNSHGFERIEQLIGNTDYEINSLNVQCATDWHSQDELVLNKQNVNTIEIFTDANQETFVLTCRKVPLINSTGTCIGIQGICFELDKSFLGNIAQLFSCKLLNKIKHRNSFTISCSGSKFNLSMRESECLFYLLRGKTAKEIAQVFKLSPKTIEYHMEQIKNKFSVQSKSELIEKAIEEGYFFNIPESLIEKIMH